MGTDWTNLVAGFIGALATLIAAAITIHFQGSMEHTRKRGKRKGNQLTFRGIDEKNSFSALDVVKIIDFRGSPSLQSDIEGNAALIDSHLIVRERNAGNGVVFCYATSGSITGKSEWNIHEWGEIGPHSPLKRGISAKSFALGVDLEAVPLGEVVRITNRVVYRGAFDDAKAESFETHIDRSTPSLTFLFFFSPSYPCRSVKGEVDVGRDQWKRVEKNRPILLNGGTLLYWRVFAEDTDSLQHLSKYRLRWTWSPSRQPKSDGLPAADIASP